jgi:hypothetical protein
MLLGEWFGRAGTNPSVSSVAQRRWVLSAWLLSVCNQCGRKSTAWRLAVLI